MSRAKIHEVSSPISLFPFIGILLCTMGALLVVLVAVSRSARTTAQREVQAEKQHTKSDAADDGVHKKLEEVSKYVGSLAAVRGQAERKLRDEQLRLSHVEDHIRRLHDKMRSLETAAIELDAMEKEHYDDREQAEREIKRLHQLIEESKNTITSLQEAGNKDSHSYAVIPYEGPNGTFRRPIYIECVKNELVLQPEGVRISADDLRGPLGAGNPLAAALRASRDYIVRLNPAAGQSRDTEPYPLLLVRPDGLHAYDRARQAIEAGDFDLGFELVESDWKVKYPQPDPQLADLQQQALEQARVRQQLLAAAAPRAYRNGPMVVAGEFDDDGFGGGASSGDGSGPGGFDGGAGGGPGRGGSKEYMVSRARHGGGAGGDGGYGEPGNGEYGGAQQDGSTSTGAGPAAAGAGNDGAQSGGSPGAGDGDAQGAPSGTTGVSGNAGGGGGSGGGAPPGGPAPDKNLMPDGYQSQQQGASVVAGQQGPPGAMPPDTGANSRGGKDRIDPADRGKDWALREKPGRAVAVRRTIRVAVCKDQLAIVSDSGPAASAVTGKVIPMRGDTVESLDELVKQVHKQIDGWGIAGNGLYWRPVILLDVGADGQRRADDLARLLKNSGLEIRNDETARTSPQGVPHETR